ncbi:MAG: DegV family EDD domain-containing protein, partial [Actinomycetota bacterium]|nr:DegV family EDD domain-containing protein [Actinomycetota bacterium]
MTTTALVTDSTSYLPPGLADALGITVVSMHVVLDGRSVPEVELDPAEFYRRLRAGATPTTSQPAPGEFLQAYDAAGAERVLCVTAAAALSGSHQSALLAAGMTDLPVDVVDSGTIGGGLCLVVLETARGLA